MILYLGTTVLAKLYIEEADSAVVRHWVNSSEIVATCRIAYTEMIPAIELRYRQRDFSKSEYELIIRHFSEDWLRLAILDFEEQEAGLFVKRYKLRRFSAIHLSAAKLLARQRENLSLAFSSTDEALCRAASEEGFYVMKFCT
jgi:uncharacterized protein